MKENDPGEERTGKSPRPEAKSVRVTGPEASLINKVCEVRGGYDVLCTRSLKTSSHHQGICEPDLKAGRASKDTTPSLTSI